MDLTKSFDATVIIPAYQSELFLGDTLTTVANQTVRPREVIVIDDGSTDATCCVVETFARTHPKLSVRLLRQHHQGPGAARNAGILAAGSDWIAFLDSDDLWHQEKLAKIANAVEAHPEGNFFYHNVVDKMLDGTECLAYNGKGLDLEKSIPRQLYHHSYFSTLAVVCRRDLIHRWGGFDETLSSSQDYELWLRLSPELAPVFVAETLGTHVNRRGNISTSRFWKRLLNALRLKLMHRQKVGVWFFAYCILHTTVYHFTETLRVRVNRLLNRGTKIE